tara:strand:- start:66 stop:422 length:357 start_codon:yes stop_codon:yes gene_type:complete
MVILQSSTNNQTFSFIPREYTAGTTYTIKMKDESSNSEAFSATTTTFTAVDYYYQYSDAFVLNNKTLKENTMYMLEIKDGNNVVFKDKVFCTNQNVTTYSVNKDVYTSNTTANNFIVL